MGMFQENWFQWARGSHHESMPVDGRAASAPVQQHGLPTDKPMWVIYASETGVAEDFADDTCRRLKKMGRSTRLLPLDEVDVPSLAGIDQVLFLASTCGDGEPPSMADAFDQRYMRSPVSLPKLHYGLLSLGDSRYDDFCAFGRQLHQWLRCSGARPLFEPVEMDDEDASAARQWQDNMRVLAATIHATAGAPR